MADLSFVNTREFSRLITKPSTLTVFDMAMLEDLVTLYPFSYPLHVSYAYALKKHKPESFDDYLARAVASVPDRALLYKIFNNIAEFENSATVDDSTTYKSLQQEIIEAELELENNSLPADEPETVLLNDEYGQQGQEEQETDIETEQALIESTLESVSSEPIGVEEISSSEQPEPANALAGDQYVGINDAEYDDVPAEAVSETEEITATEEEVEEQKEEPAPQVSAESEDTAFEFDIEAYTETRDNSEPEDIAAEAPVAEEIAGQEEAVSAATEDSEVAEELIYEESGLPEPAFAPEVTAEEEEAEEVTVAAGDNISGEVGQEYASALPETEPVPFDNTIETVIPFAEHPAFEETIEYAHQAIEPGAEISEEAAPVRNEIIGNIASVDYFIFDKSAIDPLQGEDTAVADRVNEETTQHSREAVSRYNDDKMPFSFLWWLDKTRREHAGTYQPYAPKAVIPAPPVKRQSQLEQQIIENIFHIQPEINVLQNEVAKPLNSGMKRREDVLIEKFITEDPHIRPPKADKLDTENKARKSSEDNLDLVSETLAKIYTDQMLYHKAIDTYQKLSLKFPEKSGYFAGQIRELEKKIN